MLGYGAASPSPVDFAAVSLLDHDDCQCDRTLVNRESFHESAETGLRRYSW